MTIYNSEFYEVGLDWLTFTVKFDNEGGSDAFKKYNGKDWEETRNQLIDRIANLFSCEDPKEREMNSKAGYTNIITYDNLVEIQYSGLCYMGIYVQFSGDCLRHLRKCGFTDFRIIQLLDFEMVLPETNLGEDVVWHPHLKRGDIAIDVFNTNITVEKLANKVTRTNSIGVYYDHYDKKTNTYSERPSRAEAYAQMNHGIFNTLYIGRPTGSFQARIYNKYEEQVNSKKNPVSENIKTWVRAELVLKDDAIETLYRSVLRCEDDVEFKNVLPKMFLRKCKFRHINKNGVGGYHKLTQIIIDLAKDATLVEYSSTLPDDLFNAKFEHMMGGSGLVSFVQILKQLDPNNDKKLVANFFSLVESTAENRPMSKDISAQLSGIIKLVSESDYVMPF